MTQDEIVAFVEELGATLVVVASEAYGAPEISWGDTFFIYDPEMRLPPERHFPYATIVNRDVPGFDEASDLGRESVFRVNVWVSRETFRREVGGGDAEVDFASLDRVIPHPVYGRQGWLSILNPGASSGGTLKELLREAHSRAQRRYDAKTN